jgi:beta-lactamase class A
LTRIAVIALLLAVLALAGCGDGDVTTTATAPAEPSQGSEPTTRDGGGKHAGSGQRPDPLLSNDAIRELERFAERAPGRVGIAVAGLDGGKPVSVGDAQTGRAWSTIKTPILVTLLDRVGGESALSAAERAQAESALTSSDNEAAQALFDRLAALEGGLVPASRAVDETLRRAGDQETRVNTAPSPEGFSTYGQTMWSATASALFFRALAAGCLLPRGDTDYVLSLMKRVVPDQSWGLGQADAPEGSDVAFKGGWGPEPEGGYLVRQSGSVTLGKGGYALSLIAIPDDTSEGSFESGQALVSEAAEVVTRELGDRTGAAVTCEK